MPTQRFLLCCLLIVVCLFTTGCQPGNSSAELVTGDPNASQVILLNTNTFPKDMAGVWINEHHGWILRFEEDGRLSKIRHTIGRADLTAGQTSTFPLIDGGDGFIEPGPWTVQYNDKTRELVVDIILKNFKYNLVAVGFVGGSSRDIFMGSLPEKGETTWTAQWISRPEYVASTADKTYTDYELPFEAGDEDKGEIIFEKLDMGAPQNENQ